MGASLRHRILSEDLPEYYRLGWDTKSLTMTVDPRVASEVIRNFVGGENRWLNDIEQKRTQGLPLDGFILPHGQKWGYGEAIDSANPTHEGKIEWAVPLPRVSWVTGGLLSYNLKLAYNISATLCVIFRTISQIGGDVIKDQGPPYQVVAIDLVTKTGHHGGAISVHFAKSAMLLLQTCQTINDDVTDWVSTIMRIAWHQMNQNEGEHHSDNQIYMRLDQRKISFHCPGDGILQNETDFEEGKGIELITTDVDSPVQQLTLLTGIASLCDQFRLLQKVRMRFVN